MSSGALGFSSEALRMCEQVNLHVLALGHEAGGKWVAIKLSDGSSDGIAYPTRAIAISHQLHWSQCCYVRLKPWGQMMMPREAESYLTLHRSMYSAGFRLQDPEQPYTVKPLIQVAAPRRGSRYARAWRGPYQ